MEQYRPAHVWVVCVLAGKRQMSTSLATVLARFQAQKNIKNAKLVFVSSHGDVRGFSPTDTYRLVAVTRPNTKIGELRNLAKTYVANEVTRDRDSHLICHWDESDIYEEDYLATLLRHATTDRIWMLRSAVHYDATSGYICARTPKQGVTSTLAYSPFSNFAFAPVIRNEFQHVYSQLTENPTRTKQLYNLQLALRDLPPTTLIRRYDELNSESRNEFLAAPTRDLTPAEKETVRDMMDLERERIQSIY